jgi:hypothetical protein
VPRASARRARKYGRSRRRCARWKCSPSIGRVSNPLCWGRPPGQGSLPRLTVTDQQMHQPADRRRRRLTVLATETASDDADEGKWTMVQEGRRRGWIHTEYVRLNSNNAVLASA